MQPGHGGDRHAGLHGLLDQPDLFLGSVAPAAVDAGNISTRSMGFDIGVRLGLNLGPPGYATWPVELGAAPIRKWRRECAQTRTVSSFRVNPTRPLPFRQRSFFAITRAPRLSFMR